MIYLQLFYTFFKVGLFTIGGGYAMIPLIQQEILAHAWATQSELIDFVAISESTPGPFAVNVATFVGMHQGGPLGAVLATLGVVLPSFLIILFIATKFAHFQENRFVKAALYGLQPAVVGLVATAGLSVFFTNVLGGISPRMLLYLHGMPFISYRSLGIAVAVFIVSRKWKKLHPIWLILIGGALGVLSHLLLPALP